MVSLDRCMIVPREKIEADRARLRAFGANAVTGRFLGVLRHERLEFGLGALVVEKRRAGGAEEAGQLGPRVRFAHVDDPDRLDPWPRRLDAVGTRGLSGLYAAPEAALGGDEEMLV